LGSIGEAAADHRAHLFQAGAGHGERVLGPVFVVEPLNAVGVEACQVLTWFMEDFARRDG
jgi:hypothetical protein